MTDPTEVALTDVGAKLIEVVTDHRGDTRRRDTLEFQVRYFHEQPEMAETEWRKYSDIATSNALHDYLRAKKMKTLIPKNFR